MRDFSSIVMMSCLALVAVFAIMQTKNSPDAKIVKAEVPVLGNVKSDVELEEVIFKCKKEETQTQAKKKALELIPLNANE